MSRDQPETWAGYVIDIACVRMAPSADILHRAAAHSTECAFVATDHHQAPGPGHGWQPHAHGRLDVREEHTGDPPAPAGSNVFAIPLAAGALAGLGFVLPPAVGALLMSGSAVVVALDAQVLRRVDLQRDTPAVAPSPATA